MSILGSQLASGYAVSVSGLAATEGDEDEIQELEEEVEWALDLLDKLEEALDGIDNLTPDDAPDKPKSQTSSARQNVSVKTVTNQRISGIRAQLKSVGQASAGLRANLVASTADGAPGVKRGKGDRGGRNKRVRRDKNGRRIFSPRVRRILRVLKIIRRIPGIPG